MNNFLKKNNVIKRTATRNKTTLFSIKEVRQNMLETMSQNFGNNFITNIAKGNLTIIRNKFGVGFLGIKVI